MRKLLGLVGATLLFAGPALAADLGTRPPAYKAAPLAPVFTWTGFYLGVHGGYGWSSSDVFGIGVFDSLKGGFAGGQIGYNYQINNFVLGIEGDGAWADISQSFDGANFKFDALASLRGRLGVAYGNALLYGTAGGGWAHGKFDILGLSDSQWQSGWTAGAGIEYAFQPNWTGKVEYLHYGLSSATYFSSLGGAASGKVDVDTIKVGINYLFH
jgi:outer membrane immunogenic protein